MLDELSNQASLIILIISVITGTFLGEKKGDSNIVLKKANYCALSVCALFSFLLVSTNKDFLMELDSEVVKLILIFYLSVYIFSYMLFLCSNSITEFDIPLYKRFLKGGILFLSVIIVMSTVLNLKNSYKYLPKDTIVKIYDNEKKYYLLKAAKDIPVEVYSIPRFKTEKLNIDIDFRTTENKIVLKKDTVLKVLKNDEFLIVADYEKYKDNGDNWISLVKTYWNDIFIIDRESSFLLSDDLEVQLTDNTVLTIYRNSFIYLLKFFMIVCAIIIIIYESYRIIQAYDHHCESLKGIKERYIV